MSTQKSPSFTDSQNSETPTVTSRRFQDSTHLIPSRIPEDQRFNPLALWLPVAIGTPLIMLALGVALEIGVIISGRKEGFAVPKENKLSFASGQFLLSFVPTLFIIPVAFLWRELDWYLRWYQPYVLLQRGNASAEESLLLDYIALGPFYALFYSTKWRHRVIFWSSLTAVATYILQPLASSVFSIQQRAILSNTTITSTRSIGLIPDVDQLNAFVAAAGFADAAVFNNLSDPPFITEGWATAEFEIPDNEGMNATVVVHTTGIQTHPNCDNPKSVQVNAGAQGIVTIHSSNVEGCDVSIRVDTTFSDIQYGVNATNCGDTADEDVTLQPVMFWYFHRRADNGDMEARTVFCAPSITPFTVRAQAYLQSRAMAECNPTDGVISKNNVTGAPLNGRAFNGVVFPPNNNPFIQARATTTNTGVPGAIFRFASQLKDGPQSTFDLPNGFLDITSRVYTQHLALTAKNVYFVAENTTLPAEVETFVPRLWIAPLPGHALAFLLFIIGFIGTFLHIINRRQRRHLFLASPPGSIAGIISMTSHSGFGRMLVPYDSELSIEDKLKGLRFRLDNRTGAIVADDEEDEYSAEGGLEYDSAMESLLGKSKGRKVAKKGNKRMSSSSAISSTEEAQQAAAGYPPWRGTAPLKTPYDPL